MTDVKQPEGGDAHAHAADDGRDAVPGAAHPVTTPTTGPSREWLTRMGDAEEGLAVSAGVRGPTPAPVQQAVERMRYDAHASQSSDGRVVVGQDDLDTVLAALAEAQRERDNAMGHAKQEGELRDAAEAELATLRVRKDSATCVAALQVLTAERDAAQADAAKLREALCGVMSDLDPSDWGDHVSDGILTIVVEERHADAAFAALAAPPSTAAMSETDLLLKIRASTAATTLREMLLRAALDGCGAIGYGSDEANMDVATDIVDRILGSTAATPEGK